MDKDKTQFSLIEKVSFSLLGISFILGFLGIFIYLHECDKYAFFSALFLNLMQLIYIGILFLTTKVGMQREKLEIKNLVCSSILFLYGLIIFIGYFTQMNDYSSGCSYGLMPIIFIGLIPVLAFCFCSFSNINSWGRKIKMLVKPPVVVLFVWFLSFMILGHSISIVIGFIVVLVLSIIYGLIMYKNDGL